MGRLLAGLIGVVVIGAVSAAPAFAVPGPANDNFASATAITAGVSQPGSNVGATKESGEPNHSDNLGGKSVWFKWTAPASGKYSVDLVGSDFDTVLAVYTGNSVSALTLKAADDDNGSSLQSRVAFSATSGTVYRIAVDGWRNAASSDPADADEGNISLLLDVVPPPANDNFASPELLTGTTDQTSGQTFGATKEAGEPNHADDSGGASVWYQWTAPAGGGTFEVDTFTSDFDTLLAVYTGSSLNGLTEVASNDDANPGAFTHVSQSRVGFTAVAGVTYMIAVDGWSNNDARDAATGNLELNLEPVSAPTNDDFGAAEALADGVDVLGEYNVAATSQAGEPGHGGGTAAHSVWFDYTAPAQTNVAYLGVQTDGFAPRIGVYEGGSVSGLTSVGQSNQFAPFDPQPGLREMYFPVTPGHHYAVAVDGAATGWFGIYVAAFPGEPNDPFASPRNLSGDSASANGNTTLASAEANEPSHAGYGAYDSLWYEWTATSDGETTLTTAGSPSDTRLAVYTGGALGSLSAVASNDDVTSTDLTSAVSFDATAGTVYRIAVDQGLDGPGAFHLALVHTPDATPTEPTGPTQPGPTADKTPPDTVITKAPTKVTTKTKSAAVSVEFQSTEAGSSFACSVDNAAFSPCNSPDALSLKKGTHTIQVRATDAAGNTDPSPASARIRVKQKKKKHHHHHHHHRAAVSPFKLRLK